MPDSASQTMPTLYIPHGGGPCFFMEWTMGPRDTWQSMAAWLRQIASSLPEQPKALLIVSAHWEEAKVTVNNAPKPALLYDYYGFPAHAYELKYDAPGAPDLAKRVQNLLAAASIESAATSQRGLDHGVFIPFKLIYPDADIPIVQISLVAGLDPAKHLQIGQALTPLRREGVLIVGSGMSYHNMSGLFGGGETDSKAFDAWLQSAVCLENLEKRHQLLTDWKKAPAARNCHPREEHLIPLMVAAGAGGTDVGQTIFSEPVNNIAISAFRFG